MRVNVFQRVNVRNRDEDHDGEEERKAKLAVEFGLVFYLI